MDRAEAGLRAQTGEKPGGGYYTSSERINLQKFSLGRITTLPRSVFGSRAVSGGGGSGSGDGGDGGGVSVGSAIVVRPQVSLVDRAQDLRIQSTQQSVGGLQQILDVIRVQISELNQGVNTTARLIQGESALEQNQLRQEQESERRLAERKVRSGRESELERGIIAALVRPIAQLQQKLTSLFDRIMGAMTTLFFGWLTNQGIETLKAFSSGDSKKLEEIKNTVVKNILYAIGAFAAINIGFGLLLRTITSLTLKLAGLVTKIALAPFKLAGAAIATLFGAKGAKPTAKPGGRVPITTSGGKVLSRSGGFLNNFFGGVKNVGRGAQGVLRGTGNLLSKLFAPAQLAIGTYRIATGDPVGGALSYGSAIPGLGLPFLGLDVAREMGFGKGTWFGKKENQSVLKPPSPKPSQTPPAPAAQTPPAPAAQTPQNIIQPQIPAAPQASDFSFSIDTENKIRAFDSTKNETSQEQDLEVMTFESLRQNVEPPKQEANIQAPPKPATPVGTLPEPKPNIIMLDGGTDRTQPISTPQQEPLTDVPFIPSSNIDNFYVLYSQLNYNVVM